MTAAEVSTSPATPVAVDTFRGDLLALIPFLRAFSRTLCGHRDQADDLCQEALAKAWQSRASFQPGTNLKAWLFMILRNQFYTEKRKSWRQRPWEDEHEQSLTTRPSQEPTVALSQVALKMRKLPPEQREALILVSAGGFSYEDAARICNCPVGTIKSRVSRGRLSLERAMAAPASGPYAKPERVNGLAEIEGDLDLLKQRDIAAAQSEQAV